MVSIALVILTRLRNELNPKESGIQKNLQNRNPGSSCSNLESEILLDSFT